MTEELKKCGKANCQPEFQKKPNCCDPEDSIMITCHCGRVVDLDSSDKITAIDNWNYEIRVAK